MAGQQGFYKDPVGRRIPYHLDGTKVYASHLLSDSEKRTLNDSNTAALSIVKNRHVTLIFEQPMTLTHEMLGFAYRSSNSGGSFGSVEISTDAKVEEDGTVTGTWTYASGVSRTTAFTPITTRENPRAINYVGVTGWRVYLGGHYAYGTYWWGRVHLYGYPTETPVHKVVFVDQEDVMFDKDFDFGDRPKDVQKIWNEDATYNHDSPLYIKNISPEKEAYNITLSSGPTNDTQMSTHITFSDDYATYTGVLEIDKLMPGETYGPIYVKRAINTANGLSLKSAAAELRVGSWV